MIGTPLFEGELVRLAADDLEKIAGLISGWGRDSEFARLLDTDPPRLWSVQKTKKWLEQTQEKDRPGELGFMIHTLEEDRIIGFIGLDGIAWTHGDAWVGIGIGDQNDWNKGFGTDALQVLLRYAFLELNLHRLSLNVFEYNQRAVKSYEKAGFRLEGRARQSLSRDERRWDLIFMGILRREWEKRLA